MVLLTTGSETSELQKRDRFVAFVAGRYMNFLGALIGSTDCERSFFAEVISSAGIILL